jgi:hypothetical protein
MDSGDPKQDDLPARYELTLRNFGKMCIDALIHDKFYFTREEIIKVLPDNIRYAHCKKKVREFPVPSRDVTTKLSLGGNNDVITELFLPKGSSVSDIPGGDGKLVNLFLRCKGGL